MAFRYADVREDRQAFQCSLSTTDIQKYLQKMIDLVCSHLRKEDEKYANLPNIQITVAGAQAGEGFLPIIVALPGDALLSEVSSKNENIPSIFYKDRDDDGELRLIPEIANLLKLYTFKKADIEDLKSKKTQSMIGIKEPVVNSLISYTKPRYKIRENGDGDETRVVLVAIDSVKILKDMIREDKEDMDSFDIKIDSINKIRHGEYKMHLKKIYGKNKAKDGSYYKDLDSLLIRASKH